MAFQIQGGWDPGGMLARQELPPDPMVAQQRALALRNAQREEELYPLRKQATELELGGQQLAQQERQVALDETKKWQAIMGKHGGDYEKARPELASVIRPTTLATIDNLHLTKQNTLADISKKKADTQKVMAGLADEEREALGGIAMNIADSKYNPTAFDAALSMVERTHPEYKDHIQGIRDRIGHSPETIQQIVDSLITPNARKAAQALANQRTQQKAQEAQTSLTTEQIPGARAKSQMEVAQANALTKLTDKDWQDAIDNVVEDKKSRLYRTTQSQVGFYRRNGDLKGAENAIKAAAEQLGKTDTAVATAKATLPFKIEVAGASAQARSQATQDAAGLTEDDYARAGEQYQRTGVMPSMGRDSATRGKIVHAGNQWARDNGFSTSDIVTMQAAYAGDKDSLKKFQTQRDAIASFEQTAQKNLQLMLDAGKKLVDTGSPWLNKPLRSLNRSALGSDAQAAFDAANLIAQNEVAKVTSGGGLGGVLSDSARHEMKQAMGENPTIGNMIAVAKILKQDMENRHQAMDSTLSDIKSRIGGGGAGAGGQPGGQQQYKKTATGANGHKIGTNDNGATWYDVQTGQKVQ